jgi:hypothetical protein
MAAVKLNAIQFSKTISESISSRILLDFASKGKREFLSKDFDAALEQVASKAMVPVQTKVEETAKDHYKKSFDIIAGMLNSGLTQSPAGSSFPLFSKRYYRKKLQYNPATAKLFWKFKGNLSRSYRAFAGARKSAISRSKSTVSIKSRDYKYRKRIFRYQVDMKFPVIAQNAFLDNIFRKAYFNAANNITFSNNLLNDWTSDTSIEGNPLAVLVYNETQQGFTSDGEYRTTRPFITKLMANRGQELQSILERELSKLF